MSVGQQKQFLETLLEEMDSKKIKAYRRAKADKQHHNFTMSRRSVRKGLRDYLKTQDLSKKAYDDILHKTDKYVKQFIKAVKTECARLANKDDTVTAVGVNTAVKISYAFEIKNGKSRYDKIGGTDGVYAKQLKVFKVQFADVYGEVVKTKDLLQLSHAEFEGIIESAVSSAIDTAVASQAAIGRAEAKNFLRGRGIDLKVLRDTKTTTMNVELASAEENAKDKDASKARLAGMRKALVSALESLSKEGKLLDLPGSDSFRTLKKKKVVNSILDPFRNKKNVKVTTKQKIKHSRTKSKKSIKPKDVIVAAARAKIRKTKATRKATVSPAAQPLQMLAMINAQLPKQVEENMQDPALNYQTGRFARSVRATDITKTPKGFPSIGYTYQKSPYQTFETGYKQGSVERDPRRLIDQSIRELATQFALGRLYTRRL